MKKKLDIKLFLTDIDGVWTDGGMYYDNSGNEWKKFNTSDSAGVLFLKLVNIPTAIITGENTNIVKLRAEKLKIDDYFLGVSNKVTVTEKLLNKYKITWNEVAFIGDDINDIELLQKVGLSACPKQSPDYVKNRVDWVLNRKGGEGVYREFVEKYLKESDLMDTVLNSYLSGKKELKQ